MVTILYGQDFLEASKYLSIYGVFMVIYTLGALLINFFLSRERVKVTYFSVIAAILQTLGIWFYHDSVLAVIHVNIIISLILFIGLTVYLIYEEKIQKI